MNRLAAFLPLLIGQSLAMEGLRMNPARVRSTDPDWQFAKSEIYKDQKQLKKSISKLSESELRRYVVKGGPKRSNKLSLTFDDGPHPEFTLKLLDILRRENVKATFFVVGFMADRYPELVQAIMRDGHEVGNHSYSHVTLNKISGDDALTEWRACSDVVKREAGFTPRYCRPPGGDFDRSTLRYAAALGMKTVLWTDDPGDYANPGDSFLLKKELRDLTPGGIVLLHDGSPNTVDTLDVFIRDARSRGLQFVTLDELQKR